MLKIKFYHTDITIEHHFKFNNNREKYKENWNWNWNWNCETVPGKNEVFADVVKKKIYI